MRGSTPPSGLAPLLLPSQFRCWSQTRRRCLLLDASLENAADTYSPCTFAAAPAGLAATGQLLHPGGRVLLRKHKRAERSLDATYDATPGVLAAAIILSAVSKNARYL